MMEQQKRTSMPIVGIVIWRGRAYIPIKNRYENGLYLDSDPIYVIPLREEDLVKTVEIVKKTGNPIILGSKTREEFLTRKSPILSATGAKSWKQLAKTGASYTIDWTQDRIQIDMSRLDKKGRWEYDPEKKKILPPDTSIERIIDVIMEDVNTRPEVYQGASG